MHEGLYTLSISVEGGWNGTYTTSAAQDKHKKAKF